MQEDRFSWSSSGALPSRTLKSPSVEPASTEPSAWARIKSATESACQVHRKLFPEHRSERARCHPSQCLSRFLLWVRRCEAMSRGNFLTQETLPAPENRGCAQAFAACLEHSAQIFPSMSSAVQLPFQAVCDLVRADGGSAHS